MASTLNLDGRAPCSGFKWLCNCGPAWTPFMGKMFQCSADCCENANASMEEVHQCIERCHAPLAQAQATVTGELERFQNRLQRCMMDCNDRAKDAFNSGVKEPDVRLKADSCVSKCVDDHAVLIPSMTRTLKESLMSIAK
ncbi:protein FAM136A isoform X1 [Stegostoma tigrinum]|uniref:protein FAM136A isoform X1 n=1 Tax=Stegostoma tigrinum TaxID=3053191 RepID=UPI0028708F64|nr:protein FAM136A isoform X1 [Stegostoma tigrinum]